MTTLRPRHRQPAGMQEAPGEEARDLSRGRACVPSPRALVNLAPTGLGSL